MGKLTLAKYLMKNYIASVRINGATIKTVVPADSSIHARLLLQFLYGMNSIIASPVITESNQPPTPEQQRIDALTAAKEKATANLTAERKRQQVIKAQKALTAATQIKAIAPKAL